MHRMAWINSPVHWTPCKRSGAQFLSGYVYGFLAEGRLRTGAFAEGLAAVEAGLALARRRWTAATHPSSGVSKGELLLALSAAPPTATRQPDRRDDHCHQGFGSARSRALPVACPGVVARHPGEVTRAASGDEPRPGMAGGRADRRGPRHAGGDCDWFNASLASADLVEAKALLGELAHRPRAGARRKAGK